jgi:HEAT repeat protein
VLLGEPGAGKTTALEALTYRLAHRALIFNLGVWLLLALTLAIAYLVASSLGIPKLLVFIIWLVSFVVWEPLVCRYVVPCFIDAKADYDGKTVSDWQHNFLEKQLGRKPMFGSRNRIAMLIDGLNEIQTNYYEPFIQGWRSLLRKKSDVRVVFSSREGEDPSPRLETTNPLTRMLVCDLSDPAVLEFLKLYRRKKSKRSESYSSADQKRDFDQLKSRNLLAEGAIGRNPYWLKMIVENDIYTRNRSVLFRKFAESLIKRELTEKPEARKRRPEWKNSVPIEQEMNSLATLALTMHRQRQVGFASFAGWKDGRKAIREALGDLPYSVDDVLFEAEAATLIRLEIEKRLEFVHQLVQEFFAAYALYKDEARWSVATEHAEDIWWWQTIFFLGGLLNADVSTHSCSRFMTAVLGDQLSELRVVATIGALRVVEDAPSELARHIAVAFASSIKATQAVDQEGVISIEFTDRQITALKYLGQALGDDAADAFAILLDDPDRITRYTGSLILAEMGGRRAAELLIAHLDDEIHRHTGMNVIASLGELAVAPLIVELQRSEYATRPLLKQALVKIGSPAVEALIGCLKDELSYVRSFAAEALGATAAPRAVDPLIELVCNEEEFPDVREAGAKALGEMGELAVDPLTSKLIEGGSEYVTWRRRYLFKALAGTESSRAIEFLIAALGDFDRYVRDIAIVTLGQLGDIARRPTIAALKNGDVEVRHSAAKALKKLGYGIDVPALVKALKDEDYLVRASAAYSLGNIGDPRAVEPLISLLANDDVYVCVAAAEALGNIRDDKATEPLINALSNPNEELRGSAAEALGKIGDPRAVPALANGLKLVGPKDEYYFLGSRFAQALGKLGEAGIHQLLTFSDATDLGTQLIAHSALSETLREAANSDIERVSEFLHHEDPNLRGYAAKAIGETYYIENERTVAALIEALKDGEPEVRSSVLIALAKIRAPLASSFLVASLKDTDAKVRAAAAEALGQLRDPSTLESLLRGLEDEDRHVREHAVMAIASMREVSATENLVRKLQDESFSVRAAAVDGLSYLRNPEACEALMNALNDEAFMNALNDEDSNIRDRVIMALGNLQCKSAVTPLLRMLAAEEVAFRRETLIEALGWLGDARAVEPLAGMLKDERLRYSAARALREIGDPRAIKPLIAAMKGADSSLRAEAAKALGMIGHEEAVGSLTALLKDKDLHVRRAGEDALARIRRRTAAVDPVATVK